MAEPQDSCISFWKTENRFAEIGNDFTEIGTPDYTKDGKFNKGYFTNNVANHLRNTTSPIDPNKFAVEVYPKPIGWSITNGGSGGISRAIWGWGFDGANHVFVRVDVAQTLFQVRVGGAATNFIINHADFDIPDGTVEHFFILYDRSGMVGGANTVRVYFKGALIFSSAVTPNNQPNSGFFVLGVIRGTGGFGNPFTGVLDNPRIYDKTSQVFIDAVNANIGNEEWPVSGYPITNKYNFKQHGGLTCH